MPLVQLKIISAEAAASANVPAEARLPFSLTHFCAFSLLAVREPIITSCPRDINLVPMVLPTTPVPRTAIFMV
jgi:hypothetical protein